MLVTGATGYVASLVLPALRERYALTLVDVTNEDRDGHRVDDVQILDLLDDPDDRLLSVVRRRRHDRSLRLPASHRTGELRG